MSLVLTANPARTVDVTFGGKTFRAGQATYANLLDTQAHLSRKHPGAVLRVIQPCYNTGVVLSAGTHDKDAVLDVEIPGMRWLDAQTFLRTQGWGAWWRHTGDWADPSDWHIHMVSLGAYKAGVPVGEFIPGQVTDYYHHAEGLKGEHDSGDDPTWHPADIDRTVFNYAHWRDNDMPYNNWPDADKKALANDVAAAVLDAEMNATSDGAPAFKGITVRGLLKKVASKVGAVG